MKKMSVTTTLALLLVLILGSTVAYATFHWCPDDPVLSIDGREVHVIIGVPDQFVDLVKGPVHVQVYVPRNVEAEVIDTGDGFNGKGERVTIVPNGEPVEPGDAIEFKVKARVQTNDSEGFPVAVLICGPGSGTNVCGGEINLECPGGQVRLDCSSGWSKEWVEGEATLD